MAISLPFLGWRKIIFVRLALPVAGIYSVPEMVPTETDSLEKPVEGSGKFFWHKSDSVSFVTELVNMAPPVSIGVAVKESGYKKYTWQDASEYEVMVGVGDISSGVGEVGDCVICIWLLLTVSLPRFTPTTTTAKAARRTVIITVFLAIE
jgi:hypothetical protein